MRVGQRRQQAVAEVRVVEPLRADQQHVDRARAQRLLDGLPLLGVRRVDRVRGDAGACRRLDLVAHQRQQRRHDQRRPGALGPQQPGGHEVHRRLAPPGALHDERPATARRRAPRSPPTGRRATPRRRARRAPAGSSRRRVSCRGPYRRGACHAVGSAAPWTRRRRSPVPDRSRRPQGAALVRPRSDRAEGGQRGEVPRGRRTDAALFGGPRGAKPPVRVHTAFTIGKRRATAPRKDGAARWRPVRRACPYPNPNTPTGQPKEGTCGLQG